MDTRRLHIGITKTTLKNITVQFDDKGISLVSSTVGLLTDSGHQVADHTAIKSNWTNQLEITPSLEHLIMALGSELHRQSEAHIMGVHGLIEEPKKETETTEDVPF